MLGIAIHGNDRVGNRAAAGCNFNIGAGAEERHPEVTHAVADAIVYAVDILGPNHVALGSDFDGSVTTAFDASESAALVDKLVERGLEAETIGKVMGENQIAFFLAQLPDQ